MCRQGGRYLTDFFLSGRTMLAKRCMAAVLGNDHPAFHFSSLLLRQKAVPVSDPKPISCCFQAGFALFFHNPVNQTLLSADETELQ